MTINIAIAVAEGMVMAADSVQQVQQFGQVMTTHASVEKLTEIGALPMAAMAHGVGAINNRTILSLIREWEFSERDANQQFAQRTVAQITGLLADFIEARYNAVPWGPPPRLQTPRGLIEVTPWPPLLGIVVGGYSPGQFFPEFHQIVFPGKRITQRHPLPGAREGAAGIAWWGVEGPLSRVLLGFDLQQLGAIHDQVVHDTQTKNARRAQQHAVDVAQARAQGSAIPAAPPALQAPPDPRPVLESIAASCAMPVLAAT